MNYESQKKATSRRDADAWRGFLLASLASNDENNRFVLSAALVALGLLVSVIVSVVGGDADSGTVLAQLTFLAIGAIAILVLLRRWVSTTINDRRFVHGLLEDLLEGGDVDEVATKWRERNPRRESSKRESRKVG